MRPQETRKEFDSVKGLFAHYARWLPDFSTRFRPLSESDVLLGSRALQSFQELNDDLAKANSAAIRDDMPFEVETDASGVDIAGILAQPGRAVTFIARAPYKHEKNYAAVEKEALAIIETVRKWEHFLKGRHFTLVTNQKCVSFIFDKANRGKVKNAKLDCLEVGTWGNVLRHFSQAWPVQYGS